MSDSDHQNIQFKPVFIGRNWYFGENGEPVLAVDSGTLDAENEHARLAGYFQGARDLLDAIISGATGRLERDTRAMILGYLFQVAAAPRTTRQLAAECEISEATVRNRRDEIRKIIGNLIDKEFSGCASPPSVER